MSIGYSCSSSTYNECRKQNRSLNYRSDKGWKSFNVSSIYHYGVKSVLRFVRTTKNRGKQFWGCPKYKVKFIELMVFIYCSWKRSIESLCFDDFFKKNGSEYVCCNYFRWCSDDEFVESGTYVKCKGKDEKLWKLKKMEVTGR